MAHRTKRHIPTPSQPSIRSFFPTSTPHDSDHAPPPSTDPGPRLERQQTLSPPLPAQIQSSLLNVGMRVRKSVPEGYKVPKTPTSDSDDDGRAPASSAPAATGMRTPTLKRNMSSGDRRNELVPFCGLHAVGGWGSQAVEEEAGEGVTWSQPTLSTSSFGSVTVGGEREAEGKRGRKKRSYEEEVEDEMDAFFDGDAEGEVGHGVERRIAPLKNAGGRIRMRGVDGVRVVGDFNDEDVGFLQPMDVD